ncbi:MAG TPA: hypothetical protein VN132_03845, partial [Bdellovibrio sp.]|nr:hypothetical protein [Bdellovibrio sp.]
FFLGDLNTPGYIRNPEKFFRFLIAYHDIGKGIAFEYRQDKSLEVEYSYPIAWRLFLHSGFNQSEARLGIALIHQHQVIGDFLRKKISADQAAKSISRISENLARTSVQHFFPSLEFLFVCDASSYPYLRNKLFTQNSEGKLELIDLDQYLVLKNTVLSLPTK